jgi:hypothetical protein
MDFLSKSPFPEDSCGDCSLETKGGWEGQGDFHDIVLDKARMLNIIRCLLSECPENQRS